MLVETAPDERPDVENADHVARDEQRHAEHRPDAFLAQNRVEHFRFVDVFEDHRLLAGRHTSREAAADRDPNAGRDLFLDPDRGACDELVGLLVEQQDGTGVDADQVTDPRQQHVDQRLDVEMRQSRVRDGLQPPQPIRVTREARCHSPASGGFCPVD